MAYNKDTDYTKLINDAVAKGDYASAAQLEVSRNEKVADLNKTGGNIWNAQITNDYSQYLPQNQNLGLNTDLHTGGTPTPTPLLGSAGGGGGTIAGVGGLGQMLGMTGGSAAGVGVFGDVQQTIKDQMNQNSMLWWNASPEEKLQLEAQNKQLAAQLGGNVSYNAATGTWSGAAGRPTFDMSQLGEKPTLDLSQLGDRPTFDMGQYMANMPSFDMSQLGQKPTIDMSQLGQKPTIDMSQLGDKPTYESQYGAQMDALLQQVLNRDKFSYDAESDPLYQQYKAQYNREGTRAMQDTLASMASGAGGMNTWAVTAAQQANDYHMAQLADKVPELYQLAYSMYMDDYNRDVQNLGLLTNAENDAYGRYRDTVGDFNNERNFMYGMGRDQINDWLTERDFQYGMGRDQINDWLTERDFSYGMSRDQMNDWYNMLNFGYGMSRDQANDWNTDRNFLTDQYNTALGQWNSDRNFDYGAFMDQVHAWETDRDFNYGVGRDQIDDERYKDETAYNRGQDALDNEWRGKEWERLLGLDQEDRDRWNKEWATDNNRYTSEEGYKRATDMIAMGVMPDEATLAAAGLSPEMATAMIYSLFPDQAPPNAGGPGGPGGPGSPGDGLEDDLLGDGDENETSNNFGENPDVDWNSVINLGFGINLSQTELADMVDLGLVDATVGADGKAYFTLTDKGKAAQEGKINGTNITTVNPNDANAGKLFTSGMEQLGITPPTGPIPPPDLDEPAPTPTPSIDWNTINMTGTTGIGTNADAGWQWIMNQLFGKNKKN